MRASFFSMSKSFYRVVVFKIASQNLFDALPTDFFLFKKLFYLPDAFYPLPKKFFDAWEKHELRYQMVFCMCNGRVSYDSISYSMASRSFGRAPKNFFTRGIRVFG
jgi:hypothetical protein